MEQEERERTSKTATARAGAGLFEAAAAVVAENRIRVLLTEGLVVQPSVLNSPFLAPQE
jgi:hypothetical protein